MPRRSTSVAQRRQQLDSAGTAVEQLTVVVQTKIRKVRVSLLGSWEVAGNTRNRASNCSRGLWHGGAHIKSTENVEGSPREQDAAWIKIFIIFRTNHGSQWTLASSITSKSWFVGLEKISVLEFRLIAQLHISGAEIKSLYYFNSES